MGDTTRRLREAASQAGTSNPAKPPAAPLELQIRIHCAGKSSANVLEELQHGLLESLAQNRDPLIVLEELGLLRDSITNLIKGLSRMIVGFPRPVTFWESSGFAEDFLSIMEAPQRNNFQHPPPGTKL